MPIEDFLNIRFMGFRGANKVLDEFTLADLPFMNPYDWIFLLNIVLKDEKKYEPIVTRLKMMIICYILEIAKINVEITLVLKKRHILEPEEEAKDIQKLKLGVIWKEHCSVMYNRKVGDTVQRIMFFLRGKHLYSTSTLKTILSMV